MSTTREEPIGDQHEHGAQAAKLPSADQVDQRVLHLLLFEPGSPLWAIDDLVREIGSRIDVHDSLSRLQRAGLIHRLEEGFVFVSRTADRAAAVLDPYSHRASWVRGSQG